MNCWIHFSLHWIWWKNRKKTEKKKRREKEEEERRKKEMKNRIRRKREKEERVNISIFRIWVDNVYMYNAKGNYQSNVCNFSQNNQIIKSCEWSKLFHLLYPLVAHTFFCSKNFCWASKLKREKERRKWWKWIARNEQEFM